MNLLHTAPVHTVQPVHTLATMSAPGTEAVGNCLEVSLGIVKHPNLPRGGPDSNSPASEHARHGEVSNRAQYGGSYPFLFPEE